MAGRLVNAVESLNSAGDAHYKVGANDAGTVIGAMISRVTPSAAPRMEPEATLRRSEHRRRALAPALHRSDNDDEQR